MRVLHAHFAAQTPLKHVSGSVRVRCRTAMTRPCLPRPERLTDTCRRYPVGSSALRRNSPPRSSATTSRPGRRRWRNGATSSASPSSRVGRHGHGTRNPCRPRPKPAAGAENGSRYEFGANLQETVKRPSTGTRSADDFLYQCMSASVSRRCWQNADKCRCPDVSLVRSNLHHTDLASSINYLLLLSV